MLGVQVLDPIPPGEEVLLELLPVDDALPQLADDRFSALEIAPGEGLVDPRPLAPDRLEDLEHRHVRHHLHVRLGGDRADRAFVGAALAHLDGVEAREDRRQRIGGDPPEDIREVLEVRLLDRRETREDRRDLLGRRLGLLEEGAALGEERLALRGERMADAPHPAHGELEIGARLRDGGNIIALPKRFRFDAKEASRRIAGGVEGDGEAVALRDEGNLARSVLEIELPLGIECDPELPGEFLGELDGHDVVAGGDTAPLPIAAPHFHNCLGKPLARLRRRERRFPRAAADGALGHLGNALHDPQERKVFAEFDEGRGSIQRPLRLLEKPLRGRADIRNDRRISNDRDGDAIHG